MTTEHHHYYITPDVLPKPGDSDTEWMQRTVMLADMMESVARDIFEVLRAVAPIVVAEDQLAYHLLAGLGLTMRGIAITGTQQLEKRGVRPLDAKEDQLRIIRDQLAKPGLDPKLREALLTILQHNLEEEPSRPTEPTDFPEGGFVIGGE